MSNVAPKIPAVPGPRFNVAVLEALSLYRDALVREQQCRDEGAAAKRLGKADAVERWRKAEGLAVTKVNDAREALDDLLVGRHG